MHMHKLYRHTERRESHLRNSVDNTETIQCLIAIKLFYLFSRQIQDGEFALKPLKSQLDGDLICMF